MARYTYKIVNHLVGVEAGGTGEDRLTATFEIDSARPTRIYITLLKLVRQKYSAHNAAWFSQRPFGLYMLLTPEGAVNSNETGLVYNHINPDSYGITVLPACNPYSWTTSDTSYPRVNAIIASADLGRYDSHSGQVEPYHVIVARWFTNQTSPYTDTASGTTATFIADTSNNRLWIDLDSAYNNADAFARLYVKFNQFGTHTTGADWFGWTSTFAVKDALSNAIITYNGNGGKFTVSGAQQTSLIAIKELDSSYLIRSGPDVAKTYTCQFSVPAGVTQPANITYSGTFSQWNTQANGQGVSYPTAYNYTSNNDLTLYAQWNRPMYGSLPVPSRAGYIFTGWSDMIGGAIVDPTDTIPNSTTFTLYANWAEAPVAQLPLWKYNANSDVWERQTIQQLGVWQFDATNQVWNQIAVIKQFVNGAWEDLT